MYNLRGKCITEIIISVCHAVLFSSHGLTVDTCHSSVVEFGLLLLLCQLFFFFLAVVVFILVTFACRGCYGHFENSSKATNCIAFESWIKSRREGEERQRQKGKVGTSNFQATAKLTTQFIYFFIKKIQIEFGLVI